MTWSSFPSVRTRWWKAPRVAIECAQLAGASLVIVLTVSSAGRGEEFRVSADATLQEEFQDNVLFSPTVKESSWLTTLAPGVNVRYGDEHTSMTGSARWDGRVYSTDSNLNTVNHLYTAAVAHRRERATGAVSASVIRDTTLDSELQQTGIVLDRDLRISGTVGMEVGYALSELTQTELRYRYTDTSYGAPTLADYFTHEVGWQTERVLSEANQTVGGAVNATVFVADPTYRSQEWRATASYGHPLSEQDQVAVTAGVRWTRVETGVPSGTVATDTGLVGEARLTRQWEAADLSLAVSKRTNPSGSGRLVDTTRVALHGAYALTDRATATLRADWYRNTEVASFGRRADSTFVSVELGISWRLGERLAATAAYTHARQRLETGRVDANRVLARLVYEWYRWE